MKATKKRGGSNPKRRPMKSGSKKTRSSKKKRY